MNYKKVKILVLGVGGNVSISILKAIRKSGLDQIYIYGACVASESAGFAMCDEALICPYAHDESFTNWLNATEQRLSIDIVLSGVEEVNLVLAMNKIYSSSLYLAPEISNLTIFNDKLKTVQWLNRYGINAPKTYDLDDLNSFPKIYEEIKGQLIVKPKSGKGSKGIYILDDARDLSNRLPVKGCVAQELIGTEYTEFTCGVYKSKFNYIEIIVMKRILRNGSTYKAEVVRHPKIERYCREIAKHCETTAPFNVQLRVCDKTDEPYCFEINMRLSGTTSIRHEFGFKDCMAWIQESFYNRSARDLFKLEFGTAIRYEEEFFFKEGAFEMLTHNQNAIVRGELLK